MPEPEPAPSEDRPLAVLHVCSIRGRGGTGYMASRCCRLLHEAGHTILVGAHGGSKMEERARDAGIQTIDGLRLRRGLHPLDLWHDVALLRRTIIEHRIDIIHAWHSIEYWTCLLATRGTRAQVARTRGLVTPLRGHLFNRMAHARTGVVFATCGIILENYRNAGLDMNRVIHFYDGVDTTLFRPGLNRRPIRDEYKIPEDALVAVNVGRCEGIKGQETFIEAIAKLNDRAHGMIAGDGSKRAELEALAGKLGVADRIHFLGVRSDIPAVLAGADVYALTSVGSEGSSRATLEAMACALPCVTTTVGMLPDIVKPGRTGLLFAPRDADALAECLDNLFGDRRMRERLGQAAHAMVQERHTEATMVAQLASAYQQILAGRLPDGRES